MHLCLFCKAHCKSAADYDDDDDGLESHVRSSSVVYTKWTKWLIGLYLPIEFYAQHFFYHLQFVGFYESRLFATDLVGTVHPVTGQLADCQLADWTSRGLDNSRRLCELSYLQVLGPYCRRHPRVVQSATCPVRELAIRELPSSRSSAVRLFSIYKFMWNVVVLWCRFNFRVPYGKIETYNSAFCFFNCIQIVDFWKMSFLWRNSALYIQLYSPYIRQQ